MRSWVPVLLALVHAPLGGCPKPADADAALGPVPDDVPKHDPNGPVAGPRAVVEGTVPLPPPDTPGAWGPLHPYIAKVRRPVTDGLLACMQKAPAVVATGPTLVAATIAADGSLRAITVTRSSGAEPLDACVIQGFRQADLPPPPPEILAEDGAVTLDVAFR